MTPHELAEFESARNAIREVQENLSVSAFPNPPLASVVIITFKRHRMLECTIEQLLRQDYPELEIIIVDSSPNAIDYFLKFPFKGNGRLTYIVSQVPFLCVVRNMGLLASRGKIVIFIDDDVYLDTDFVSRHVALHQSEAGRKAKLIAGNCIGHPNEPSEWVSRQVYFRPNGIYANTVYGVNFSIKRDMALFSGGFNPYIRQVGDEIELFSRIVKNYWEALNGKGVVLVHRVSREGGLRKTKLEHDEARNLAVRMADNVLRKISKYNYLFLPLFISYEMKIAIADKAIKRISAHNLSCFIKEFFWYSICHSLKSQRHANFFRESSRLADPRVLSGQKDVFSRASEAVF